MSYTSIFESQQSIMQWHVREFVTHVSRHHDIFTWHQTFAYACRKSCQGVALLKQFCTKRDVEAGHANGGRFLLPQMSLISVPPCIGDFAEEWCKKCRHISTRSGTLYGLPPTRCTIQCMYNNRGHQSVPSAVEKILPYQIFVKHTAVQPPNLSTGPFIVKTKFVSGRKFFQFFVHFRRQQHSRDISHLCSFLHCICAVLPITWGTSATNCTAEPLSCRTLPLSEKWCLFRLELAN